MNTDMRKSIFNYNEAAGKLADVYNSVSSNEVHPHLNALLPTSTKDAPLNALDLGCGSGRDALWLARKDFKVVAIDAAPNMIRMAQIIKPHHNIRYMVDEMPSIELVRSLDRKYDVVLLSAVWMHMDASERDQLMGNLKEMTTEDSLTYITLRHGPSPAGRPMLPVSHSEISELADKYGFTAEKLPTAEDKLKRDNVVWEYAALRPQAA